MTCRCLFFSLSLSLFSAVRIFVSIFLILEKKNSHAHWIDCLLPSLSLPRARALVFPLVSFFIEQNVHSSVQSIIHLRQTKEHQQQKKRKPTCNDKYETYTNSNSADRFLFLIKENFFFFFFLPAVLSVVRWRNTLDYPYDHDRCTLDLTTSRTKKRN